MIKDGKYRFTLQFGMGTDEEQRAGKLLEQLGKRKSPIVVAALNEYVENHPELLEGKPSIQFHISGPDPQVLKETILQLIEERLGSGVPLPRQADTCEPEVKQVSNDILDMLSDLDCFT